MFALNVDCQFFAFTIYIYKHTSIQSKSYTCIDYEKSLKGHENSHENTVSFPLFLFSGYVLPFPTNETVVP